MATVTLYRYEAEQDKLPACCMRCGAPPVVVNRQKFSWSPSWVRLLILCGILPWMIVGLLTTQRMRVLVPLCERHKNHWSVRSWFGLGGLFFLILLAVAVGPLLGGSSLGWMAVGVLGSIWLITAIILSSTSIRPVEITPETITLAKVSQEFVEALRAERLAHPLVLPEPVRRSSSSVMGSVLKIAVGVCLVLLVTIVALAALGTPRGQPRAATAQPKPLVDQAHHFRLNWPGPGWTLHPRSQVQKANPLAVAGAEHADGRVGLILVEPVEQGREPDIVGREEAIGRQLIAKSPLRNKHEVRCGAVDFLGYKAVRYQFTADDKDNQRLRLEATVFAYQGTIFQVWTVGSAPTTAEDGSGFLPFVNAFALLPGEEPKENRGHPGSTTD